MKITMVIFGILLVLVTGLVSAHEHNREEAKQLIDSKVSCDKLSEEQLEMIGEYYMEQMHPGEQHEMMDNMMGGEGSESLKQMHINMARMMYCGEGGNMMGSGGMMGMMPMMGMMQGMMGNNPMGFGYSYFGVWNIIWLLFWIGVIVLIFWFVYKFVIQKGKETPMEILKKRFVKGEITKKQFEKMKKEIS